MTLSSLFAIYLAFAMAAMSPGPNLVMAATLTTTQGRSSGWSAGAGVITANFLFALIAIYGMSSVVAVWPGFTHFVRLIGGTFLLWFAWKLWNSARDELNWREETRVSGLLQAYGLGLMTNLSNPKAMTFFFSIFAVLVPIDATNLERASVLLGCGVINIAWYLLFVYLFGAGFVRAHLRPVKFWLNRSAAVFLGGLGIWMIATLINSI